MTVAIFSIPNDAHAYAFQWGIRQFGGSVEVLCLSDLPDRSTLTWDMAGTQFEDEVGRYPVHDFQLLLLRRRWPIKAPHWAHNDDQAFIEAQAERAVDWILEAAFPPDLWLHAPAAIRLVNNKVCQLSAAEKAGLNIPKTVVTNSPDRARRFVSRQPSVVKPLRCTDWLVDGQSYFTYTAEVSANELVDEEIQLAPMIYQERIEKKAELRVMVFGARVRAVRLNSLMYAETAIDWRRAVRNPLGAEQVSLPDEVLRRIRDFCSALGLRMGVFDFIVDQNDNFVFLEVNESGQFLWLEDENPELLLLDDFCAFLGNLVGVSATKQIRLADFFEAMPPEKFKGSNFDNHKVTGYSIA